MVAGRDFDVSRPSGARVKHTWIFLTGLALFACGCQSAPPPPQKPQLLTPPTFDLGWRYDSNDKSPIVSMYCRGDNLFAYTQSGTSYVMLRKSGKLQQIDAVPGATGQMKAPALLKDTIVYATAGGVYLYDLHGNITRSISLKYTLTSGVAGVKDNLFVAEAFPDGGRMAAIDLNMIGGTTYDPHPETIEAQPVRWEYLVQRTGIVSTPVVLKDAVYVAGENGSVAALATSDREPIWPLDNGVFQCGDAVLADLAVDDFGVYIASYDSKLYCLNPNNGKVRWQYYAQAPLTATPVATKDLVFEFVPEHGIVAIDKFAGADHSKPPTYDRTPRWTAENCTDFLAEDAKYVYLLRNDKHISARDKITGNEVFASKRGDIIAVAANNADGTIYATLAGNQVIAVNAVTLPGVVGELVFDDATGGPSKLAAQPRPDRSLMMARAEHVSHE
jgi:outer membrane protein assembly factor BamB